MRIGSLFTGHGGLDCAVQAVLGGELAWYSEIEPAACRLLEHHHPDVPNLGDITTVDWSGVERVQVLTGGFPCVDVSSAGKRAGMRPGTRSGLWSHMAYAISELRPELVVIENVRGLLSADAHCDLEPCPWCVGDDEGRPLRALGGLLGDLASLGLDARWCGLRASDVGAPHGRFRVFVAAWPSDPEGDAWRFGVGDRRPAAHPAGVGRGPAGWYDGVRAAGLVTELAADTERGELQRRGVGGVLAGPEGPGDGEGPQRERDRDAARDGGQDAADTRGEARPLGTGLRPDGAWRLGRGRPDDGAVAAAPHADSTGRQGPESAAGQHIPARGATTDPESLRRGEGRPEPARCAGGT